MQSLDTLRRSHRIRSVHKVLVADDNRVMLSLMKNLLTKNGYDVTTAGDGLTVLETLADYKPDAIFIDLIMPNIDGERLCRIIRRMPHMKNVVLVIISALAAEEKIAYAEWGANACVAKGPFHKMSKRILALLEEIDVDPSGHVEQGTLGLEEIQPREITKELLYTKRHLEAILSSVSEGILEITPTGKIVFVNPEALHILEQSEEKLLASDILGLFGENDGTCVSRLIRTNSQPSLADAQEFHLSNGKEISLSAVPVKGDQSKLIIINDVSIRKRLENELRQAQKLEAIGTLAGGIAHDFNNLLMGIQGRISLMLMSSGENHFFAKNLKSIEDIVMSGSNLTRQLLGFARGGKYTVEPTDLNDIILKSSEMFGRTTKEVIVHTRYQEKIWTVDIDRGQIEQALLNLYINAWQAMPGGGDLYIETQNVLLDESTAHLHHVKQGRYVRITVTDTGMGMDERTRLRIFEPFFTTKEMGRGTGLGLASTYGIIKGHNGIIDVRSGKGEGSTFTIYLPATDKKVAQGRTAAEDLTGGHETILVVDDEEVVTDVIRDILESLGYSVMVAQSGQEAIDLYRLNKDRVDLVIMDMIMPKLSGGETFDILKSINPEVKVILSSGYSIKGQATKIMERGCRAFLQKPFNVRDLSKKVRGVLDTNA